MFDYDVGLNSWAFLVIIGLEIGSFLRNRVHDTKTKAAALLLIVLS